jgi:phage terminase large subunit GpA-like protein
MSELRFHSRCPKCGAEQTVRAGESARRGAYSWWTAEQCPSCGRTTESDGDGRLPEHPRRMMVEQHGHWSVWVETETSEAAPAIAHAIREVGQTSLADALASVRGLRPVVSERTRAEADAVEQTLLARGVRTRVVRSDAP